MRVTILESYAEMQGTSEKFRALNVELRRKKSDVAEKLGTHGLHASLRATCPDPEYPSGR